MTMLKLEDALKELRTQLQRDMEEPAGILASVYLPWTDTPLHLPLPGFNDPNREPSQVQKVTELFQLGFMLASRLAGYKEVEYMLFSSVMWMVSRAEGQGIVGTPAQQDDRLEVVQIMHSVPDGITLTWFWPLIKEGDSVIIGESSGSHNMVTPLTSAFWAGIAVGKIQRDVYAKAHPER